MIVAKLLQIRGRVQGVFFRESMRKEAERLGVVGWVRNREDGSVEAWLQGPAEAVASLTQWARVGPPRAEVKGLSSEDQSSDPDLQAFSRRETLSLSPEE